MKLKTLPKNIEIPNIKLRKPTRREVLLGLGASLMLLKTSSNQRRRIPQTRNRLESQIENYVDDWINPSINSRDVNRTGWLTYSLDSNEFLANVNGEEFFQAASMIKPFVGLAYLAKCFDENESLQYGPNGRRRLQRGIQLSRNSEITELMRTLGGPEETQETLSRYYPEIAEECRIISEIPRAGREYRNQATLRAYSKLCWQLANREDKPEIEELKRLMGLPGRDRIYTGTSRVNVSDGILDLPNGTQVWNKTGSTAKCIGDFGLIKVPSGEEYIFAGVVEREDRARNYTRWQRDAGDLIRGVSRHAYTAIRES